MIMLSVLFLAGLDRAEVNDKGFSARWVFLLDNRYFYLCVDFQIFRVCVYIYLQW